MLARREWQHRPDYKIGASFGCGSTNSAANRGIAYHNRVYRMLQQQPPAGLEDFELWVEPWFQEKGTGRFRQPDALLVSHEDSLAIVVEVKMNWKDGRADKLLNEYLPLVRSALRLEQTYPLLVTGNLRGYDGTPLLGLEQAVEALAWEPSLPCPLLLVP